jgi:hypothetical protein
VPAACKRFAAATLRWLALEAHLAGGEPLGDADRGELLAAMQRFAAGDMRAFGIAPPEVRRYRLHNAIRSGAHGGLTGRPQARELHDRLRRYARRAYAQDCKGAPSFNVVEFAILESNRGAVPSEDFIRKVLSP